MRKPRSPRSRSATALTLPRSGSRWLDAVNWPGATLFSLEHADRSASRSLRSLPPIRGTGVRGVINLLESAPEEPIALRATALIDPEGWLADRCRARRADEDLETLLTRRCLTWKTTERYLDPIVEFARAVGLSSLIQRVNEARHSRLKTRVARADDKAQAYTGKNFMTRRMYEHTKGEPRRSRPRSSPRSPPRSRR